VIRACQWSGKESTLGHTVSATFRLVVITLVCIALIFTAVYLSMRGYEIVALLIALPAVALMTIGIAKRFLLD
jgi:hypothetical protein